MSTEFITPDGSYDAAYAGDSFESENCPCCKSACDEFSCALWYAYDDDAGTAIFKRVPCHFNMISWPGVTGETLGRFCGVYIPEENNIPPDAECTQRMPYIQNYRPNFDINNRAGNLYGLLPTVWFADAAECPQGSGWVEPWKIRQLWFELVPTVPDPDNPAIRWTFRVWAAASGSLLEKLAEYQADNIDPWESRQNMVLPKIYESPNLGNYYPGIDMDPYSKSSLSTAFPASVTFQPDCYDSGYRDYDSDPPQDAFEPCVIDNDSGQVGTCLEGNTCQFTVSQCQSGYCSWTVNPTLLTWQGVSYCAGFCGCGPEPVCLAVPGSFSYGGCFEVLETAPPVGPPMTMAVPLARKAGNLLASTARVVTSRRKRKIVPDDVRDERMATCSRCDHNVDGRCEDLLLSDGTIEKGCGCVLKWKTALSDMECPIGEWGPHDQADDRGTQGCC